VLSVAVDEGWIEDNPAHAIDRGRIKERRDPMMLPQENSIAAVIAAKSRFTDVAEFALETGMREAEILGLGHDRIDRDRRVAMLYETKTRRLRAVPLSALAMAIIDRQPQYLHSSFVFWRGDGASFKNFSSQFYKHVTRVLQKALQSGCPLTRFRFHDLRHLFAVRFLREGRGGIYDLQQILGHASIKTTEIYLDHLTPDEKRGAMQGVIQNALQDQRFAAPIIA
jgi:integrase/recombinase XerD